MNIITLKYPAGEFTQAELAVFNGMEKLAVYLPMKEAIAKGILNFSGTRATGKRPANLYQVSSKRQANIEIIAPVPLPVTLTAQPIPEAPPSQPTPPVPLPDIFMSPPTDGDPLIQLTPPVVNPEPIPQLVVLSAPNPAYPCPLCEGPMVEISDATGVMVKCYNVPCDPLCKENVYGHGKNVREAYEVAKQKFQAQ